MESRGRIDSAKSRPADTASASAGAAPEADPAIGAVAVGVAASGEAVRLCPREDLYRDAAIASMEARALAYLQAGVAVHFRGPAGVGKTTLALQLAARRDRPTLLVTGDGWMTAGQLIGEVVGSATETVRDRFVHSVTKTKSATSALWEDRALTIAMQKGYTLVYDEFTRSPAEANNPLLAALEERVLALPGVAAEAGRASRVVTAHPEFRVVLTSNPSDYAAVKTPQDALLDRMITFDLAWIEPATEIGVVASRSGLSVDACRRIVAMIRGLRRETGARAASMRSAIVIAQIAAHGGWDASTADQRFVTLCFDVLAGGAPNPQAAAWREAIAKDADGDEDDGDAAARRAEVLARLMAQYCGPRATQEPDTTGAPDTDGAATSAETAEITEDAA